LHSASSLTRQAGTKLEENEKQETENRKWKTGQLTSFPFPISGFRFSISFSDPGHFP